MTKKRLGDLLIESGIITLTQLEDALHIQKKSKKKLGDVLTEQGFIKEEQLIEVLEFQLGIPHVSLYKYQLDSSLTQTIPERLAINYQVLPIKKNGNKLTVAMVDPLDYYIIEDLRMTTGFNIEPVIATKEELQKAINRFYGLQESLNKIMQKIPKNEEVNQELDSDNAPVSQIVNQIIKNAIQQSASDIHIEPMERELRIRFRIDGVLKTEQVLPKHLEGIIIARLKILSNLNIAEKRLPQDGRFKLEANYKTFDIRVSTMPTVNGEKVVLRILDLTQAIKGIEQLGFNESHANEFRRLFHKSHGLILITGPTGSGKTSTLYSAINELNHDNINIITVEDPVEYQLPGINQVQVNEKIGLTFAKGLRSILRQDPNVIMVGEIRDKETAEMAITSALTGHLVLSTIHTNDSVSTITRLIDMEIEPYLISSSINGIVAQRLVRKVCADCSTEYIPNVEESLLLHHYKINNPKLLKGKGCSKCNMTGYKGRIAIYELLKVDDRIREMIVKKQAESDLKRYLTTLEFKTLMENGLEKVEKGITTISEIIRVTNE